MKYLTILLNLVLAASAVFGANLPSSFIKCDRNREDINDCLPKAIENGLRQLTKPIKEAGLPNLKPLEISQLVIEAGNGPIAFTQNYYNLKVFGFTDAKVPKAKFDKDKKKLKITTIIELLSLNFNYEFNGKILLLPIIGNGTGSINLHNVESNFSFELEEFDKNGVKHYKAKKYSLDFNPKFIEFKLENLFNGDKTLGDNINQVMNDNWREVYADVRSGYGEAFGQVFVSIFNEMAKRIPADKLFGKE